MTAKPNLCFYYSFYCTNLEFKKYYTLNKSCILVLVPGLRYKVRGASYCKPFGSTYRRFNFNNKYQTYYYFVSILRPKSERQGFFILLKTITNLLMALHLVSLLLLANSTLDYTPFWKTE